MTVNPFYHILPHFSAERYDLVKIKPTESEEEYYSVSYDLVKTRLMKRKTVPIMGRGDITGGILQGGILQGGYYRGVITEGLQYALQYTMK